MFYYKSVAHMATRLALTIRLEPLKINNGTLIAENTIGELTESCSIE